MVVVVFAFAPPSLGRVLLLLLSLPHLDQPFNKQGLKSRKPRLFTRAEATVACGGFFSVSPARFVRQKCSDYLAPRQGSPCGQGSPGDLHSGHTATCNLD